MKRRDFILGGVVVTTAAMYVASAQSQQRLSTARVGWLAGAAGPLPTPAYLEALRTGLSDRGWREGQNLVIEQRWGARDTSGKLALELVALGIDVLVAQGAMVLTVRDHDIRVPTVFGFSGDPVEARLVKSFSRPSGNLTGIAMQSLDLVGKRLELLKEFNPGINRVGIIANPAHPGENLELRASRSAAAALGLEVTYIPVKSGPDFNVAFERLLAERVEGLVAFPDALVMSMASAIAIFQRENRVPAVSGWSEFAEDGNLFTYGPNLRATWRQAAGFVDRVLQGANPAELPVEQPSVFELVVNARAAQALGMNIPRLIALRTDRTIH
jgi:putative ABC transport system substrate-binding protein